MGNNPLRYWEDVYWNRDTSYSQSSQSTSSANPTDYSTNCNLLMSRILFQLNIAKMRVPFSDPIFDDFKKQLEELHAIAEANPKFVWRYQGEKDDDGYIKPYPDLPLIMGNMSAWRDYQSLFTYTFSEGHLAIMRDKRKWFEKLPVPYTVLYYGVEKDLEGSSESLLVEATKRLHHLQRFGPSNAAFGFNSELGIL